ncbi:L-arabinose transport system permease protein AraQ [Paenibacillus konkukensis]|uniref:L-arabinose transport system permease protein AraQ n=1 Tax=Paenibacillus konkukensis TaxID=2020716 RepID=A0ABY4RL17_9BACL|nr:carbohydrate ABC transporter permease [Paenibacillus konkukensis]UQZ83202.1 L-arabinose transport system permease protein AraQ [Paenibacillus konkukensis]
MRGQAADRWFTAVNVLILSMVGLISVFPLYYVFIVSFTNPDEYFSRGFVLFPESWSLISYRYILSTKSFINAIGISGFLATAGTLLSLAVTSALSYTLSRKRMEGRKMLMLMVLITTLFQPGIIPNYLLVRELGLINSVWSLIIPVLSSGWYVLLMKGFYDSIPDSLEEAATMDGCNDIQAWVRIVLPLSLPAMAAFGLFFAVGYWNTFFQAILYINNHNIWPLQVLLQNMLIDASTASGGSAALELTSDQPIPPETLKMAAVVVATIPILLVYPFLQKHFAKGAMVGSVKE